MKYTFHAANRNQANRWKRRLHQAGFIVRLQRVPIADEVKTRRDEYIRGRFFYDVLTNARSVPT